MLIATVHNVVSLWPPYAVYAAGGGVLIVGAFLGLLIARRRGHRAIAQRLTALGREEIGEELDKLAVQIAAWGWSPSTTTARSNRP